jgi:hypothetical protein
LTVDAKRKRTAEKFLLESDLLTGRLYCYESTSGDWCIAQTDESGVPSDNDMAVAECETEAIAKFFTISTMAVKELLEELRQVQP